MPTNLKIKSPNDENPFQNSLLNSANKPDVIDAEAKSVPSTQPEPQAVESTSDQSAAQPKPKRKFSLGKTISLLLIIISVGLLGAGAYLGYNVLALSGRSLGQGDSTDLFGQLGQLAGALNPTKRVELKGEKEGRTNFLLLGKDKTGSGLTDTIMIVSYYYKEKKVATINIPRDFYVYDGYGSYKINSVYPFAESRSPGKGEQFLVDFLSKEFGTPIHYWASINFQGFRQVIDAIGGIDVNVDTYLQDCLYPTDNFQYLRPCPTFQVGTQKMDGARALIYARSRETTSDFDRSRRQSIVIQSAAQKVKEQGLVENAGKIQAYLEIAGQNFRTSLRLDEMSALAQIFKDFDPKSNYYVGNWATGNGFLCPGDSADGAYIIWYCGGSIAGRGGNSKSKQLAVDYIKNLLQKTQSTVLYDASVVVLGNQSTETTKTFNDLNQLGYTNVRINNAYAKIPKATQSSVESVKIYLKDPSLKSLFEGQEPKPSFEYTLSDQIPSEVTLPTNFEDAKIVVWVS
jgi:LCP family protein required for cell wall assembly